MRASLLKFRPYDLITSFALLASTSYAQKFSVTNPHNSFVYLYMETRVEVFVNGYSCKSIKLRSSFNKIETREGNFLYFPTIAGIDTITVSVIKSGVTRKIGQVYFYVRGIPDPEPIIGNLKNGYIKKGYLRAQQGLGATQMVTSYGHEEPVHVDSFTIIIFRAKELVFSGHNSGYIFNDSIKTAFETVQSGDKLTVTNIRATTPSTTVALRPIQFVIE